MNTLIKLLIIINLSISCAQESTFVGESKLKHGKTIDDTNPILSQSDVIGSISEEHINYTYEKAEFRFGEKQKPIDYLFVVDNSVSMGSVLNLVQQGFDSLNRESVFPENSRIAVMTTMIGNSDNLRQPHPVLTTYPGINFEPGFLDFVDEKSIANYRDEVPGRANSFPYNACKDKWFKPGETNIDGISCLSAAIQSTLFAVGAEAGILAFQQLMMKNASTKTFRDEARVNVIFVSDTHDPGISVQDLVDQRMDFAELKTLVSLDNNISSLKFHAMAPASRCTSEGLFDYSYYKLVDVAGGEKGDICSSSDYSDFLKAMVASSQKQEPKFIVDKRLKEVLKVRVNGVEVTDYFVDEDLKGVIIDGLDPNSPSIIEIVYAAYDDIDQSEMGLISEH